MFEFKENPISTLWRLVPPLSIIVNTWGSCQKVGEQSCFQKELLPLHLCIREVILDFIKNKKEEERKDKISGLLDLVYFWKYWWVPIVNDVVWRQSIQVAAVQMFGTLPFPSFCSAPFFCPLRVLNQQVIRWGMQTSVSEITTAARQQKTDANYLPLAAGKQNILWHLLCLSRAVLMPKKNKLLKLPTAAFEMRVIIIWSLVLRLAILWPNSSWQTDFST